MAAPREKTINRSDTEDSEDSDDENNEGGVEKPSKQNTEMVVLASTSTAHA
jgi:hypothetical protein